MMDRLNGDLKGEVREVFKHIIGKDLAQKEATEINMNLYGFAKALIKAKLEIETDENVESRREN